MKVQINEVWNGEGRSERLAVIDIPVGLNPRHVVYDWIAANRPDLTLATSIFSHGYHAEAVSK